MNKLLFTLFVTLIFKLGFSQNIYFEKMLLSKYSEKELVEMANTNPDELDFLNAFVKNGFYVTDFPKGKENASEISGARKIENLNNIDIFKLNIDIKDQDFQYYTLLGTDKLLVVKSRNYFLNELKGK